MEIRFGWEEDTLQVLVTDGQMERHGIMIIWVLAQTVTVLTIVLTIMDGDVIVVPQVDQTIFVKYRNL